MQKSYMARPGELKKNWYIVDAKDQVLGRLAQKIAVILMGKHHPWYTPHVDTGDFVIVLNADKLAATGKKRQEKPYYFWSGYPGGLKKRTMNELFERDPKKVLLLAVRRMLPKNRIGRKMLRKMKLYLGTEHPHSAQFPVPLEQAKRVSFKEVIAQ